MIEYSPGPGAGPVWQPSHSPLRRKRLDPNEEDLLPPFLTLTNDDDRERKALFRPPGTYNVVVNLSSFINFDDYRATFPGDPFPPAVPTYGGPPSNRADIRPITRPDSPLHSWDISSSDDSNEPDVVVLKVFEDYESNSFSPPSINSTKASLSRSNTYSARSASITGSLSAQRGDIFNFSVDNTPLMRYAHPDGRDHSIIYYYKNFVHRHLAQVHRDTLGTSLETGALTAPDVFERQAGNFLPALPLLKASLHNEEDLASDGVFLTHFLLLLYEIAAGEVRGLSYWAQHVSQLLQITLLRRKLYSTEPYNFIVWWIANIDTHVVLTGMGGGDYVSAMLRYRLLPTGIGSDSQHTPQQNIMMSPPGASDAGALPSSLSFHRRICILAAELALLTRELRSEARQMLPNTPGPETIQHWHTRIESIQDRLRRTWNVQMPASVASGYCNQLLPVGARGIFEHSFALYRSLLLYSHTAMYPTQSLYHHYQHIHEVAESAGLILKLGRDIVANGHMERKFIVFPLFMAGVVNQYPEEREELLGLLRKLEEDSIGRNMIATRQLLEIVYERREDKQKARLGLRGEVERCDVDWVGMIGELGLQVVNCRL
ncbi:uncharacterized protein KY384_009049 [Bacidia gigantensis]|uniref:uncharacterized protein n=1 Tax=Bacidia gigantensis TaxID=2732470 RepID=UPI001D03A13E|nr:uncharacterized protein KY384_009049 [Bacidia gigantensis]KAG8525405.1 hypothetical protein KY384_009049 [Bacidia gigantensis]